MGIYRFPSRVPFVKKNFYVPSKTPIIAPAIEKDIQDVHTWSDSGTMTKVITFSISDTVVYSDTGAMTHVQTVVITDLIEYEDDLITVDTPVFGEEPNDTVVFSEDILVNKEVTVDLSDSVIWSDDTTVLYTFDRILEDVIDWQEPIAYNLVLTVIASEFLLWSDLGERTVNNAPPPSDLHHKQSLRMSEIWVGMG